MERTNLRRFVVELSQGKWEQALETLLKSFRSGRDVGLLDTFFLLDLYVRLGNVEAASDCARLAQIFAPDDTFVLANVRQISIVQARRSSTPQFNPELAIASTQHELESNARTASYLQHWSVAVTLWRRLEDNQPSLSSVRALCRALSAVGLQQEAYRIGSQSPWISSDAKLADTVLRANRFVQRRDEPLLPHVKRFISHGAFGIVSQLSGAGARGAHPIFERLRLECTNWFAALEQLGPFSGFSLSSTHVGRTIRSQGVQSRVPEWKNDLIADDGEAAPDEQPQRANQVPSTGFSAAQPSLRPSANDNRNVDSADAQSSVTSLETGFASDELADNMRELVRSRNYAQVIDTLTSMPAAVKASASLSNSLGVALARSNAVTAAIAHLEQALALDERNANILRELCAALHRVDDGRRMLELSRRLVTEFRPDPRNYILVAKAHKLVGQSAQRLEVLRTATEQWPSDVKIALEMSRALGEDRYIDEALATLQTYQATYGDHEDVKIELVRTLVRAQRFAEALDQTDTDPDQEFVSPALLFERGQILWKMGHVDKARAAFQSILDVVPDHAQSLLALVTIRGEASITERNAEEALEAFSQVAHIQNATTLPSFAAGKAAYRLGSFDLAAQFFEKAATERPDNPVHWIEHGRALMRMQRTEGALASFEMAARLAPENHDAHHGVGVALRALGRTELAAAALRRALEINPARVYSLSELGKLFESAGDLKNAEASYESALLVDPRNVSVLLSAARIDFEVGRVERAVSRCKLAQSIDPLNKNAGLYLRWLTMATSPSSRDEPITICLLERRDYRPEELQSLLGGLVHEVLFRPHDVLEAELPPQIRAIDGTWRNVIEAARTTRVLTVPRALIDAQDVYAMSRRYGRRVGVVVGAGGSAAWSNALWRRDVLAAALDLLPDEAWPDFELALQHRIRVRHLSALGKSHALQDEPAHRGREIWLLSSSGVKLFGGVEQFLRTMVPIYRDAGFHPVIVGLLEELDGNPPSGDIDGVPFLNIERSIDNIRRVAIARAPVIAHGTTGIGFELASALEGLETRIIYGSHFWRDMFHGTGSFENVDLNPRPRREFGALCASVDQAYANSVYTKDMIRAHFGISQPIVYSLPFDRATSEPRSIPGDYVLLLNGRVDKGFGLVLELAKLRPSILFKVVAAQVARERMEEQISGAGVSNIEIVGWTPDTDTLYSQARVVFVPSYSFVETFSRVVIEAHRFGVPVMGSNRGNVPVLLQEAGGALHEDVDEWLSELDRLFDDDAYWHERSRLALENSRRYRFENQPASVGRLIKSSLKRIGVGVGSGIGNLIQCSPAIRRIAEHFDCPVDVILREDFAGCSTLFEGAEWVSSVITSDPTSIRYDVVLLFDCYGSLFPQFNAEVVHVARRHFDFSQMRTIHESEFNLMAARDLLGVPFEPEHLGQYFVGAFQALPNASRRVVIHAGSKSGVWLAKQWPYFPALIERIKRAGFEVASVGGPDEHVPETLNLTGTPLDVTIRSIAESGYFVGNGSGLMHVADALQMPLATIFAPSSVIKNGPLNSLARVIKIDKSCSPCQFEEARLSTCRCISEIKVDEVWSRIKEDLDRYCMTSVPEPA